MSSPLENPRLGKNDRIFGKAQFLGHSAGMNTIDAEPLERFPGCRVEVKLYDGQEPLNDMLVVLSVSLAGEVACRV
jgi:hypothetical protein